MEQIFPIHLRQVLLPISPYGIYQIKLSDPFTGIIRREVDVFQPSVWVLSGLLAFGEYPAFLGPRAMVEGKVVNIPNGERPVYVRLMGLYFEHTLDDLVKGTASAGDFTLAGFNPDGLYILLTIGRSGILDAREIKLPPSEPVVIDLAKPHILAH